MKARIRLVTAAIGFLLWAYGARSGDANFRVAGMVVLGITVVMRFLPKEWFGERTERAS